MNNVKRSNMAQNSIVPRSQEDYWTQVSEENEVRVTEKLSQEFSETKNRVLGALSRLDDFLMNRLFRGHSGTAPEMSRNAISTNRGTNEDNSQSNPHPEAGIFHNQTTRNSGPEEGHHNSVPCDVCVLKTFNGVYYCSGSLVAQLFSELCFLSAKTL